MVSAQFETASWARRAAALLVDWLACTFVVGLFTPVYGAENTVGGAYVLALFVAENTVLTTLVGGSFGKIATRLRVVRESGDPRPVDPVRALARSLLIAVVIPPLVFRPDGRGLHDLAAGSSTVTVQTYRLLTAR